MILPSHNKIQDTNHLLYLIQHGFIPPVSYINITKGRTEDGCLSSLLWDLHVSGLVRTLQIAPRLVLKIEVTVRNNELFRDGRMPILGREEQRRVTMRPGS